MPPFYEDKVYVDKMNKNEHIKLRMPQANTWESDHE